MTVLTRSIPDLSPLSSTTRHPRITRDVNVNWSMRAEPLNPSSGGRIPDGSNPRPRRAADCARAWNTTQPIAVL